MGRMLLAILMATGLARAGDLAVEVETSGGETLRGTIAVRSFKLETGFGSAEIDADKLAEIRFGEPDVVTTTDGHEFKGKLKLSSLRVDTDAGRKTLRRDDLVALVPAGAGGGGFAGEWFGIWGPMKLTQAGITVRGTYGFDDEFSIEGKVKGDRLEFTYKEPGSSGEGTFTLWEDGDTFTGTFSAKGTSSERFWGAYRLRAIVPAPKPGEVVLGQSRSGLNFHLRVPKGFDPQRTYPAIAFLHGSNMTSRAYVDTIVATWPELAEDFLLVGIDGERLSPGSRDPVRAYNFTYVEFSGPEVGPAWRCRQSPALVAEALEELRGVLPVRYWLVGGHSQGGFLTWAMAMFYPQLIRGAFPMSCDLLVQCDPDFSCFEDEKIREAQRRVALAPIHGENDGVVGFDSGRHCFEQMQHGGFPALRFFTAKCGHEFALLPVEGAVRWLETMASEDPDRLVVLAETSLKAREYRDATAAASRAREAGAKADLAARADAVEAAVDDAAGKDAAKVLEAIRKDRDNRWVDGFWEFRQQFAFTPAARDVMRAYDKLREKHTKLAEELFWGARNERDDAKRRAMWKRLLDEAYASKYWRLVSRWTS